MPSPCMEPSAAKTQCYEMVACEQFQITRGAPATALAPTLSMQR
ncbi:hypothetical protein [Streptomyces adustus]|nr:hypothetical protein [Streptomyces adustus]